MIPAATPRTAFGRALRNVSWLLIAKVVGAVLSLFYLAIVTRSLGVARFGEFSLILGTAQAAAALVGFETWQVLVRFGMAHLQRGRADALRRLVRFCIALDGAGALIGCALAALALSVMRWHFGWPATLARDAMLFCAVLLLSIRSTPIGILRLHDRYARGAIADVVTPVARFAGALVVVQQQPTVRAFLIAWAVAEILTAAAYWISAARVMPRMIGSCRAAGDVKTENAGLWRFAWRTNLNSALGPSSRQFAVILVGFILGPAAAGGYRLAHQLSQALVRLSELFSRAVFPEIARAHSGDLTQDLATLSRQSARLAIGAGLIACLAVPAFGNIVLGLVAGASYLGAYWLLVLLGFAAGLNIMAVGFEPVLLGTGREKHVLRIRIASAVILFGTMVPLMLLVGVTGAGIAALLSAALALGLLVAARTWAASHHARG
ncbi:MAG TPA: oligosaccharide flippase family protein [Sphingobium sp.]|nr:oligosaccharide flippase family protein [Sphingobium sp.]